MEFITNQKCTKIEIHNVEYTVSLHLSFKDAKYLIDYKRDTGKNYDLAIATIIKKHLILESSNTITVHDIANDKTALNTYVQTLVSENEQFELPYKKHSSETDSCYRLILAIDDMYTIDIMRAINDMCREWNRDILKTIPKIPKVSLPQIPKISFPTISNSENTIANILHQFTQPFQKIISEIARSFCNELASILPKITIPKISEERKEALRVSYERWGKYGWTVIPNASISFFNDPPDSIEDANNKASAYFSQKDMLNLFSKLRDIKGIKKKDLEEAIFDFENKQYKSCAMVSFSLLDAKLIRMQRNEDRYGKDNWRFTGKKAAQKIKKRIEGEPNANQKLFLLLFGSNLFSCINAFFEDGNDFKTQPKLINRNFLDHGMLTRNVRKRDCVQLFLLYYNFLTFINTIKL